MKVINPATGEPAGDYPEPSEAQVMERVERARAAQAAWGRTDFKARAAVLTEAARVLREDADRFARLMAEEMGKPVTEGHAEIEKCARTCDHYAEHGAAFLADIPAPTEAARSYVAFRALGLVLAVMPWNFPFWQVVRAAAPALMAGNGVLLKHAANVPGCALAIERVFASAGLPDGLFAAFLIGSGRVAALIDHPAVAAVTLTGSTPAGQEVAARAGRMLKKTVLELGGSDPYVVLTDADPAAAARTCAAARLVNGGQSCIAAKRFVVVETVRGVFEHNLVAEMETYAVGDPLDTGTRIGPLARRDLRDDLHAQVEASLKAGARLLLGGQVPPGPGAFYPPTVLTDVPPGCPAYSEELFGPVAAVIPVADEAEAIRVANDSPFGLGAAVFTANSDRGERIARDELQAGSTFVNAQVHSDPRLPFGGVKLSGYGRELGAFGIREFVNVKTVYVA